MTIEAISSDNVRQLTELVLALWEDCSFDEELKGYTSMINAESEICYLMRQQDQYVAFIHISTRTDYVEGAKEPRTAYMEGLYVKPTFRKQGIASELTKAACDWARKKGFKQIASDTHLNNSASIDFHKQTGFKEVERIVCFIKDL